MKIETDFEKIFAIGDSMDEENIEFRGFLKWHCDSDLDELSREYYELVAPKIDCTKCANCCRNKNPLLTETDIERCGSEKGMTPDEFKQEYLEEDGEGWFLKKTPCLFLKGNLCSIYEKRPETCREYPHLTADEQTFKTWKYVDDYSICPIMYNVVELLKERFNWKY